MQLKQYISVIDINEADFIYFGRHRGLEQKICTAGNDEKESVSLADVDMPELCLLSPTRYGYDGYGVDVEEDVSSWK